MTDQLRRLERRASIQTCITIFLVVLCIILIAIVRRENVPNHRAAAAGILTFVAYRGAYRRSRGSG